MGKHIHAEVIKAWADGADVEFRNICDTTWRPVQKDHCWREETEYHIKPAAPKWPETTMSYEQMQSAYLHFAKKDSASATWHSEAAKNIANAAIAHACETEQVVPKAVYDEALVRLGASLRPVADNLRAARDLAIAEAVRDAFVRGIDWRAVNLPSAFTADGMKHMVNNWHLKGVISEVTP